MDLGNGCSTLESVEDNEAINPENLVNAEDINIENNGSCAVEHVDDKLLINKKGKGIEVKESVNSPLMGVKSSSSPTSKGYGLKKWRRIRREVNKDGGSNVDSSKILKRGLSNSALNSMKLKDFSAKVEQKSEGSVSSTTAVVGSPGIVADGVVILGNPGLEIPSTFAAGTDSENSEDQGSRSSTAASAPEMRYEMPASAAVGYVGDKSRMVSLSGKNLGNSLQRGQQGKSRIETSKKPRGERVKIEKENSHSSMESDLRTSNFVFMQGTCSMTSNGIQSGRTTNFDGENSDDAEDGVRQFSEELRIGYGRKDMGKFEDVSQEDIAANLSWDVKEDESENHGSSLENDPLIESIHALQSAQEALEKEVQKLRDIAKEDILVFDDSSSHSEFASVDPKVHELSSSDQLQSGESGQSSYDPLETQVTILKQNVNFLENKVEEARAMLKVKEARFVELEAKLPREETGSTLELQQVKYGEMENELESLFRQKIEAEVEYLAISTTIQKSRVEVVDQILLLEKQNTLASEQAQILNKHGYAAAGKAMTLKREAEKLESYCEDIGRTDEVLKLQNRVFKFTSYFFIQLILLLVVLGLFVLQLSPHYAGVVPT